MRCRLSAVEELNRDLAILRANIELENFGDAEVDTKIPEDISPKEQHLERLKTAKAAIEKLA